MNLKLVKVHLSVFSNIKSHNQTRFFCYNLMRSYYCALKDLLQLRIRRLQS